MKQIFGVLSFIIFFIIVFLIFNNQTKYSVKNTENKTIINQKNISQISKSTSNLPQINLISPSTKQGKVTFAFAGDGMFGREIGYQFQNDFKKLFSNFDTTVFENKNIAWINLEGPISDQIIKQERQPKNLIFNFSNQTIEALKYLKLNIVGLANNHTLNQSQKGLEKTQQLLKESNIYYHGLPNKIDDNSIANYKIEQIDVSLIAVNILSSKKNLDNLISQEKGKNRFVIILPHWGNEYQNKHSLAQENLAKQWIDIGADLIIGMHPHVIQDAQIYKQKLVFYSLGNFVFDQTFSKETQQGLILTGEITNDLLKINLIPIQSKKLKPEILQGEESTKIINYICKNITDYCHENTIQINLNK